MSAVVLAAARGNGKPALMAQQVQAYLASLPPGTVQVRLHASKPPAPVAGGSGYTCGGANLASGSNASYQAIGTPGGSPVVPQANSPGGQQPASPGGPVPPGATVAQLPVTRTPRRTTRYGLHGFDGAEFVAGTVRGYRWWTLAAPPLHRNPYAGGQPLTGPGGIWDPGLLRGMYDVWGPGLNHAECKRSYREHPDDEIPFDTCGCGYWAYWQVQQHDLRLNSSAPLIPVVGVVSGQGQVLIGERGFRAQQARITALHLPFTIQPVVEASVPHAVPGYTAADLDPLNLRHRPAPARARRWWEHPKFTGKVIHVGMNPAEEAPPWSPRVPPEPLQPSRAEIAAAADEAEAWMAVISDYLAVTYPDAELFETLALMMATYPPEPQ